MAARHNGLMAQVVLFHSAYGLRQAEAGAAARLRAAGHDVITPDLYGGQTASTDPAWASTNLGWPIRLGNVSPRSCLPCEQHASNRHPARWIRAEPMSFRPDDNRPVWPDDREEQKACQVPTCRARSRLAAAGLE